MRDLMGKLYTLRHMAAEHRAGRLDEAHAHLPDHDANVANLRALARRFPGPHRESIESVAQRIDDDVMRLDGGTLRGRTIYFDPYAAAAPPALIRTRGRPDANLHGWLTRSAAALVPVATKDRAACIAELLTLSGVPVRSDYVTTSLREVGAAVTLER